MYNQDYAHSNGLVKGAILCYRNPYFYFRHGESTSTASQLTSPASQKSKDLNKVSLLLQDLGPTSIYEATLRPEKQIWDIIKLTI